MERNHRSTEREKMRFTCVKLRLKKDDFRVQSNEDVNSDGDQDLIKTATWWLMTQQIIQVVG